MGSGESSEMMHPATPQPGERVVGGAGVPVTRGSGESTEMTHPNPGPGHFTPSGPRPFFRGSGESNEMVHPGVGGR